QRQRRGKPPADTPLPRRLRGAGPGRVICGTMNLARSPMKSKIYGPRKRRTRQHVIADLAVHHVEGFILEEGHTAERTSYDYGYDLVMTTYDQHGCVEPDLIFLQIKATEQLRQVRGGYVFDLDVRDYNRWMCEKMIVISSCMMRLRDVAIGKIFKGTSR